PHPAFGHPLPQWGRGQCEGVASGRKTGVSSLQPRRVLQGFNRLGLVCLRIEPGIVKLEKNPLRPFEIVRVGGVDLTCPIVAEPERLDLTLESGDILLRDRGAWRTRVPVELRRPDSTLERFAVRPRLSATSARSSETDTVCGRST